jgi:probable F420-dependent oxidoreductase
MTSSAAGPARLTSGGLPLRPFRFAVQLDPGGSRAAAEPGGAGWRSLVRRIESLGYSALLLPDHFTDRWAPLTALAVAAEATTTLKIGSLVFDNDYRHPVELAREISSLDLASAGRVEFGLGAGWMKSDYDQLGLTFDRPGVRIDRMIEGLNIMKDLWVDGTSTRSGQHYNVTEACCLPTFARPHPTLIIGGGGQRVLSLSAREADIVGFNMSLPDGAVDDASSASATALYFDRRVEWVRAAAGNRLSELEFLLLTFFVSVGPDRRQILADPSPLRATGRRTPTFLADLPPDQLADVPIFLFGTVSQVCDTLQERRERYGFNYWVVHEEFEEFAPVVAALTGT